MHEIEAFSKEIFEIYTALALLQVTTGRGLYSLWGRENIVWSEESKYEITNCNSGRKREEVVKSHIAISKWLLSRVLSIDALFYLDMNILAEDCKVLEFQLMQCEILIGIT
jgi:hypothetical protein